MSLLQDFQERIDSIERSRSRDLSPDDRHSIVSKWNGFVDSVAVWPATDKETFRELGGLFMTQVSKPPGFRFFNAKRNPGTETLEAALELVLLEKGAWPELSRSSPMFSVAWLFRRLGNAISDGNVGTACWLLDQVTLAEVLESSRGVSQKLKFADGSFGDRCNGLATWFRLAPVPVLEAFLRKGVSLDQNDGNGGSLCSHLQGYWPGHARLVWALEQGADPLRAEGSEEERRWRLAGFIKGIGPASETSDYAAIKSYVTARLSQWPIAEIWRALDEEEFQPSTAAFLKGLVLENRLPATPLPARGPRL